MAPQLSEGCLAGIMTGAQIENPVMQILGTKKIVGSGNSARFRLLVSDGKYFHSFAMLASQLNDKHLNGELTEFTVVKIDRYITSVVNNSGKSDKRVLIILGLTVLVPGTEIGHKLGSPVTLPENESQAITSSTSNSITTNTAAPIASRTAAHAPSSNANSTIMGQHLTHPISSLSPYQNKWVIKARVTNKSNIRTWNNSKGEGKLFSMDLLDDSGEIRLTAFKDQCDKFYDMIEVDKVYYISKCQLKPANKQFSSLKNEYEMTMTPETMVSECTEDVGMPVVSYDFVPISAISEKEPGSVVDLIAVCKDYTEVVQLTSQKTGRDLRKREINLVDPTGSMISLTLWGTDADSFDGSLQPVVLIKGAKINEYMGGKSLSMFSGSMLKINPDIKDAHRLRGWFDNGGATSEATSLSARTGASANISSEWMTFREAKMRQLGSAEKPDYFTCKATIHLIRSSNAFYKACPQPECNKKVVDLQNGQYRCEKCAQDFSHFKYRLILSLNVGDWSGSKWVTCFNDVAEQLIGKSAQEVGDTIENDSNSAEALFSPLTFKSHIMKLRNKIEFFGDSSRIKATVVSATPVNHKEYNALLIKSLKELTGIGRS